MQFLVLRLGRIDPAVKRLILAQRDRDILDGWLSEALLADTPEAATRLVHKIAG